MQASKRGLFIGCSGYPECDYTRPLHAATAEGDNILGKDPASGWTSNCFPAASAPTCRSATCRKTKKRPSHAVRRGRRKSRWTRNLELALKFLSPPREVGHHPTTGLPIVANNGRFGPYLLHDGKFKSIPKTDSVYEIDLPRALEVLVMERAPRGADSRPRC